MERSVPGETVSQHRGGVENSNVRLCCSSVRAQSTPQLASQGHVAPRKRLDRIFRHEQKHEVDGRNAELEPNLVFAKQFEKWCVFLSVVARF